MSPFACFAHRACHIGVTLALSIAASSAGAQAWEVVDHEAIDAIKQGFQKQSDLEQKQLDQLTLQLGNISLTAKLPDQNLKTLDDSTRRKLVEKNCGTGASSLLGTVMNGLGSLLSSSDDSSSAHSPSANSPSVDQSQQQICANIVAAESEKYNKTVDMLDRMKEYKGVLDTLTDALGHINRVADANLLNSQAQVYSSALNTEMANWRAQMEAYDAMIRSLKEQQAMLARTALNGSGNGQQGTIGGSLLQTALTAALLKLQ